jgi:hypothetical protein
VYVRKNHSAEDVPGELAEKMYLLNHFESYIMNRLYGDYDYTFEDYLKSTGMDFVQKYLRMKHVVVFMMSSDVIQVCRTEAIGIDPSLTSHSSTSTTTPRSYCRHRGWLSRTSISTTTSRRGR